MASPFAVFRRNQRAMIAVLGVVTILLFVIGDPLSKIIGRARAGSDPVVVKTNYGNYTRSELAIIEQQRKLVEIFLQRVVAARVDKDFEGMPTPQDPQQIQMWANYKAQQRFQIYQMVQQELMGRAHQAGDAAAVETLILAKRAEEMGMVASDRAVNDYLRTVAGKAFSQVREIMNSIKTGDHSTLNESYLFDGLRREMLASKYSEMFRFAVLGMPPAERLGYFEQLNLKADAQVLPVKAEQFLKDVPQPSDEQLEAFFEQHQNQLPQPNSPDPGFKQPVKVAFEYFKANLDKFIEQASDQVTPEEMHEYYEENKAIQFRELALPPAKDKDSTGKEGEMEDPLGPDDSQPNGTSAPKTGAPTEGGSSTEPKDSAPAATDTDKGDTDKGDADNDKTPDNNTPNGEKPADKTEPKSSRVEPSRGSSPFRLTSAAQPAADAEKSDDAAAPADKPAAGAEPPAGEGADKPKAKTPDAEKTDAEKADTDTADADKKPSEPKFEPFEKVEEKIRTQIAKEKAQKTIAEAFEKLHAKMRAYSSARSSYLANKDDDPELKEPEPLDFSALAAEFKLEMGKSGDSISASGLISAYEAQQSDIGKSSNRQVSFLELAYLDPRLYRPEVTADGENNSYLWWITKTTPESVPSFEDVRSKVSLAFKMIEARKLALAQADKYAKQATDAKKTLKEVFGDREGLEVTDTGEFTRMTVGNMAYDPASSMPRLSPVHAVEAAGDEFMNAVFSSSPGEAKVALNQPQDIAYVVQLQRFLPSRDLLDKEFILEPFAKYARVADEDQRRLYVNWTSALEKEAGVDWLEVPRIDTRVEDDE